MSLAGWRRNRERGERKREKPVTPNLIDLSLAERSHISVQKVPVCYGRLRMGR